MKRAISIQRDPIVGSDMLTAVSSLIQRVRRTPLRWRVGVLLLAAAIIAAMFFIPKPEFSIDYFRTWGYPGVFVVTLVANASVILPTPGFLAVIIAGAVLNPLLVAFMGAAGMTLGELSGYFMGRMGRALTTVEIQTDPGSRHRWVAWTQRMVGRWGMLGIFVLAATPNPLFDIAGIAAGMAKMRVWRFLVATFAGRLIRTLLLAYASAYSADRILGLFD